MELIDLINSAIISNDLTQMINNLPTWIPNCISHSPALYGFTSLFWQYYLFYNSFFPLGNSDHVVSASIMTFCQTQNRWPVSWHSFYDYSCGDWDGLCDHLRDVPGKDIFKLSTSAAASEFCKWLQVGLDVYIPCHKYQVKPHSSAKIVNRNQLHIMKSMVKSAFLQKWKYIFLRIVIQIQVFSFPYFKKY